MSAHHAADYGLAFGELPPRLRVVGASGYVAPDSHRPHGTRAKYAIEGCRCEPCTAANSAYEARRQRAIARPDEVWLPYVPADRARRHVQRLAAAGVGHKQVAVAAGLGHGTVAKLLYGVPGRRQRPSQRIRPATEAAILAVTAGDAAAGARIPAGPTWALLDDLLARGFTKSWLARALGSTAKTPALQVGRDLVLASTARAVAELHARLTGIAGPGRRSRWDR